MQRGIAVLHYSLEAIDVLDKEGLLKKKTGKKVEKAGIFTLLPFLQRGDVSNDDIKKLRQMAWG